jgi:transposase-like protein
MGRWRRHSREFKRQAVERMKGCENIHELARELGIERKLLYTWKWQFEGRPEPKHANYLGHDPEETIADRLRQEVQQLKQALGQKSAEIDFFAAALRRIKELRQPSVNSGAMASIPKSTSDPSRKGS